MRMNIGVGLFSLAVLWLAGCKQTQVTFQPVKIEEAHWEESELARYNERKEVRDLLKQEEANLKDIYAVLREFRRDTDKAWPVFHYSTISDSMETMRVTAQIFEYLASTKGVMADMFVSPSLADDIILDPPRSYEEIQKEANLDWAKSYAIDWSTPMDADANRPFIGMRQPIDGRVMVCFYDGGVDSLKVVQLESILPAGYKASDMAEIKRTIARDGERATWAALAPMNVTKQPDDIYSNWGSGEGSAATHYGNGSRLRAWLK